METGELRHLLRNLCTDSQWSYAMFWKFQQLEHHKLLTCEDGYCDVEKPHLLRQSMLSDSYTSQEDSFEYLGYAIASAVHDMSCCRYFPGEGIIGRVALAETNFWIYSDDIESTKLISSLEHADGWLLSIAAGIETTLLAPVLPYGVLQLGSFEKVVESMVIVADIKKRFFSNVAHTIISPLLSYDDSSLLCSSILMPEPENNAESCLSYSSLQRMECDEDADMIHNTAELCNNDLQTADDQLVPLMEDGNCLDLQDFSFLTDDQEIFYPYVDSNIEPNGTVPNEFVIADDHMQEQTDLWICELQKALGPAFPRECEIQQGAVGFASSRDFELQEAALGPGFKTNIDNQLYQETVYSCGGFASLEMELCGLFEEADEQEQLLKTAVSPTYNNSDDAELFRQCNTSNCSKSSVTSLTGQATCDTVSAQVECYTDVLAYESTFSRPITSPPSLESLESATVVDKQTLNYTSETKSKTPALNRPSKGKPKNKIRPRPRDRQLIQDRLKELRDLVPNSAKSSIDGLLDQTMKHMMFLRSVTERADKAKHLIRQEVTVASTDDSQRTNDTDNYEECPIVVKDLEHPCQFQIQMVCLDEGAFFEIAEAMHKLKLTILKGVMGNRCNKWACFVVEGSKGFNRLDIFWPLMRILQQNGNWIG